MFKWWDPVYSWYRWNFKKMLLFTNTISNCPIETTSSKCLWGQAALLLVGCTIVVEIQFRLLSKNLRPGFDDSSYNGESFTIRAGSSDRHVVLYLWVFFVIPSLSSIVIEIPWICLLLGLYLWTNYPPGTWTWALRTTSRTLMRRSSPTAALAAIKFTIIQIFSPQWTEKMTFVCRHSHHKNLHAIKI